MFRVFFFVFLIFMFSSVDVSFLKRYIQDEHG